MVLVLQVSFVLTISSTAIAYSSSLLPDVAKARQSAASIFAILDAKCKIDSNNESGETIQNLKGDIDFRHVSFKYPSRPDIPIFQDLCLSIHSSKVMIVHQLSAQTYCRN